MFWSWTGQKKYIFYTHLQVSLLVGNNKQKELSISVCFCDSRMKKQLVIAVHVGDEVPEACV